MTSWNICLNWTRKSSLQIPRWTFHSLSWTQQQHHSSAPWYQKSIRNVLSMSSRQSPTMGGKGRIHSRGSSDSFSQLLPAQWSRQKLIPGENPGGETEGDRWKCKLIGNRFLRDLQWSCSEIAVLAFPGLKICQESCSNLEPRSKRIPWPRYWVEKWITHLFSSLFGHFYLWLLPWGLPDIPELCSAHTLGLGNSIWDESRGK